MTRAPVLDLAYTSPGLIARGPVLGPPGEVALDDGWVVDQGGNRLRRWYVGCGSAVPPVICTPSHIMDPAHVEQVRWRTICWTERRARARYLDVVEKIHDAGYALLEETRLSPYARIPRPGTSNSKGQFANTGAWRIVPHTMHEIRLEEWHHDGSKNVIQGLSEVAPRELGKAWYEAECYLGLWNRRLRRVDIALWAALEVAAALPTYERRQTRVDLNGRSYLFWASDTGSTQRHWPHPDCVTFSFGDAPESIDQRAVRV